MTPLPHQPDAARRRRLRLRQAGGKPERALLGVWSFAMRRPFSWSPDGLLLMSALSGKASPHPSSSSLPKDARSARTGSVRTVKRCKSERKARPGSPPTGPRPLRAKLYRADGEQSGASTRSRRQVDRLDAPERVEMADGEARTQVLRARDRHFADTRALSC